MKNILVMSINCFSTSECVPKPVPYRPEKTSRTSKFPSCNLFFEEHEDLEVSQFNFYAPEWFGEYLPYINSGHLHLKEIKIYFHTINSHSNPTLKSFEKFKVERTAHLKNQICQVYGNFLEKQSK